MRPSLRSFVASRDGREYLFSTPALCVTPDLVPDGFVFERLATGTENECGKCRKFHRTGPCLAQEANHITVAGGVYE